MKILYELIEYFTFGLKQILNINKMNFLQIALCIMWVRECAFIVENVTNEFSLFFSFLSISHCSGGIKFSDLTADEGENDKFIYFNLISFEFILILFVVLFTTFFNLQYITI